MGKWSWAKWTNPISASYAAADNLWNNGKLNKKFDNLLGGGGGGGVNYSTPGMSPQEQKLFDMLIANTQKQQSNAALRDKYLQEILNTNFSGNPLSKDELAQLDSTTQLYQDTRNTAVNKAADTFEKSLRAKWANQGIADSSIAGDSYNKLAENTTQAKDQIAKEAAMFRYGTEQDIRNAYRNEALQKIGLLNQASDPSAAYSLFGTLEGSRNAEANRALQIALANAQKNPDFLTTLLLGGGGAALGGYFGGPEGAKIGAGVGLAGAAA